MKHVWAALLVSLLVTGALCSGEEKEGAKAPENKDEEEREYVDAIVMKAEDDPVPDEEAEEAEEAEESTATPNRAPVIDTTDGKLVGKILKSRSGRTIYAYYGIPYAKPPTGDRRFKNPQRNEPWEGVRDATHERDMCPQLTFPERRFKGSENCLFLNVYTTRLPINNKRAGLVLHDVVVLLHGGGFQHGSGHYDEYGPEHLLDSDVLLVTVNYRLGALGFLATGDANSPGNYGLKDQVDALRWVRRNIDRFNGNVNSITLLGVEAGAASAHYHMLSPLSKNLFHGAMSFSGTALTPWAHVNTQEASRRAFRLGELAGCKKLGDGAKRLMDCLKGRPIEDLVKKAEEVLDRMHDLSFPFVPVAEPFINGKKSFLHDDPETMIKQIHGRETFIPWFIGVTAHEGLPQALQLMVYRSSLHQLNEDPAKYLPHYFGMSLQPEERRSRVADKAWKFYVQNDTTVDYSTLILVAELTSDYNHFYGVAKSIELHSNRSKAPIFLSRYSFSKRDSRFFLGVPQGADTKLLFPDTIQGIRATLEEEEYEVIDRLVKIVTNFALEGDPTPEESEVLNNLIWPMAEGKEYEFIDIGKEIKIITDGFYTDRVAFWEKLLNEDITPGPVKDEL